jgi:hypothetical protein
MDIAVGHAGEPGTRDRLRFADKTFNVAYLPAYLSGWVICSDEVAHFAHTCFQLLQHPRQHFP